VCVSLPLAAFHFLTLCLVRKTLQYLPSIVRYCPYDMGLSRSCDTVSVPPWLRDLNCVSEVLRWSTHTTMLVRTGQALDAAARKAVLAVHLTATCNCQQTFAFLILWLDRVKCGASPSPVVISITPQLSRTCLNTPPCTLRYVTHPSCFVRGSSACSAEVSISLARGRGPICVVGL